MKYIDSLREGMRISEVYLCKSKQIAVTKTGKEYGRLMLQDKTGIVDAKIWNLNSPGVGTFEALDYVRIDGDVSVFMGANQLNVERIRKADEGEYLPENYLPVSDKNLEEMYKNLRILISSIKNSHLKRLTESYFVEDQAFIKAFKFHSAAKSVHHGFVGGLLEHTLSVAKMCDYFAAAYPMLNRDGTYYYRHRDDCRSDPYYSRISRTPGCRTEALYSGSSWGVRVWFA